MNSEVLKLGESRKEEIKQRIKDASRWIVGRFDDQLITGGEDRSNRKLLYTTWGLRALVETLSIQDKSTKAAVPEIAIAYLNALNDRRSFAYEQEYLTILSQEVDQPLYYEDRSGLGGILLTLASLRGSSELERILEEHSYSSLLDRVLNSILGLRDSSIGLWYNQQFILSIHSYLTEAFLRLDRYTKGVGSKLEVSGYLLRMAVKETLMDETVINSLQTAIYDRVLRFVEKADQSRTIDEGFNRLVDEVSTKRQRPRKGLTRGTRKK